MSLDPPALSFLLRGITFSLPMPPPSQPGTSHLTPRFHRPQGFCLFRSECTGMLCRHAQPRGCGRHRPMCHSSYQNYRAWVDPDNPTVKVQGSVCLPSTQPRGAAACPCPCPCPRAAPAMAPRLPEHPCQDPAGSGLPFPSGRDPTGSGLPFPSGREPAGSRLPLLARGRSDGGSAPLPDAAHHKGRPLSGPTARDSLVGSLARLGACRQPSLGCSSHGRRSVKGVPRAATAPGGEGRGQRAGGGAVTHLGGSRGSP